MSGNVISTAVDGGKVGARPSGLRGALSRAGRMAALGAAVGAALLTFPGAIPWMIALWLLWHSMAALRGRRGWLPLGLCAAVVLAKRTAWTPGLGLLALAAAGVVAARCVRGAGVFLRVGRPGQAEAHDVSADMETAGVPPSGGHTGLNLQPAKAGTPTAKAGTPTAEAGTPTAEAGTPKDSRPPRAGRVAWASLLLLWGAWGVMLLDWRAGARCGRSVALLADRPVVCLGDSMTSLGPPRGGYPEHLARLIALPVVNGGRPGLTTERALGEALPRALAAGPQVVVVELGGNDFVQGRSRASVKENLEAIITACRARGAEVILMEIPRGYMIDGYAGLERELARKHDLELIADTALRRLWLSSPTLPPGKWTGGPFLTEADGLHPNARGNQLLARYVAAAIERLFGPGVRARDGG
jgi:lysophospholipase L1-like esterase